MSSNSIQSKEEIISALSQRIDEFNDYIMSLNQEQFEATPGDKWSAGQNLDHLIRSIRPLQIAYELPSGMLKFFFGLANRPSRSYTSLVEKYNLKLKQGGRASGPYIPKPISFTKKSGLVRKYDRHKKRLVQKIMKKSEEDLDRYILPHPLLGKITLREMLFFTIHHNVHHLQLIKNRSI